MFLTFAVLPFLALAGVQPYAIAPYNVITVPPNCPPGEEWINGECREVWRIVKHYLTSLDTQNDALSSSDLSPDNGDDPLINIISPYNAVSVPNNCPEGLEYINGQCREIWIRRSELQKMHAELMVNDDRIKRETEGENIQKAGERNVITVPNQCPIGYKPDALGYCRKVYDY